MSSFYNLGSWGPKQASLCFRVLSEEVTQCRLKLRSANSLPESSLRTMTFSWLFCFFPPLEYGTNWSECQWPACQPVFWLCIFPELAILSRQKKKKSFVLNNTRNQKVLCSLSDIQRHKPWMRPWPLHEHIHSHQRLRIFFDGVSQTRLPPHLQPLSEPKKSAYKNLMSVSYTPVLGCELGKAKQIFIAFVLWARPQTWAVWRRLREKMPRNRWTKRQGLHAWSKVRTHGCTHELFHPLKNEIKR